jgi:hypothetical protein
LYYDCREAWEGIGGEIVSRNWVLFKNLISICIFSTDITKWLQYSTVLFMFTFALPLIALVFIYGSIGYKILTRKPIGETQQFINARSIASIKVWKLKT